MVKAIEVVNPFEPMAIPLAGTKPKLLLWSSKHAVIDRKCEFLEICEFLV